MALTPMAYTEMMGSSTLMVPADHNGKFKYEFDLKITIQTNMKVVNFLDVTLNLTTEAYQPYSKPNSQPMYIHVDSNHPPNIIKCVPNMISDRINKISSNKAIFERASSYYNDALAASGYKEKITFGKRATNKVKSRSRKIIWFNPPYSLNVKTNVARNFLKIIDKNFPKSHKFHKIFNRKKGQLHTAAYQTSLALSPHTTKRFSQKSQHLKTVYAILETRGNAQ